jgi:hypothetical protein
LALVLGLLLGAVGGLAYAWFLNPVSLVDIGPDQLVPEDQRAYVLLISEAYLADRDLDRARARLDALRVRDVAALVSEQADRALLNGDDPSEIRALTALAEALGASPLAAEVFSGTGQPTTAPITATITATFEAMPGLTSTPENPSATPTLTIPTLTPTPDFLSETELDLIALETVCEDDYPAGRIEVYVRDALGRGVPGLEIHVDWEDQQDRFFTGMKLEIDPGYSDFQMEPDKLYTVTLVGLAEPVVGISSAPCATPSGQMITPTYQLVYAPASESDE